MAPSDDIELVNSQRESEQLPGDQSHEQNISRYASLKKRLFSKRKRCLLGQSMIQLPIWGMLYAIDC